MGSKITLKNGQDQEFSINHKDNVGAISIDSDQIVTKSGSVTDNSIVRFDGTTGKVQNSNVTIDDNGSITVNNGAIKFNDNFGLIWGSGNNVYGNSSTNSVSIETAGVQKFTVDSSGNVGVSTTPSPIAAGKGIEVGVSGGFYGDGITYQHDVQMTQNAYPIADGQHKFRNTNQTAGAYRIYGGQHFWKSANYLGTAGDIINWTNAMSLDYSGNLLHYLGGLYSFSGLGITSTDYANSSIYIRRHALLDTTAVLEHQVVGVRKAAILSNGNFQSATNSYGSTSDAKLKENVQDASPKLDKLMQVQVRTFNYIGQEDKQIGVVAQEIEKLFPGIIYETKDTKQVRVEKEREITLEDGTVDIEKYTEMETVETGEVTKNVKYSVIYMMMLKAMQEQNEIINDLKARIEVLEGKL